MSNKYNNLLRSVLTFLAVFSILIMVMSAPAQAPGQDIKLNIEPDDTKVNSAPEYVATMEAKSAPDGGFFFLNLTIPQGYNFTLPSKGKRVAKYTWFNETNDSKVIVVIISNDTTTTPQTVDVRFSTNSGHSYITRRGLPITNMVIGTTSLAFSKPSPLFDGHLNLSLGGTAGPILKNEKVKVELAKDTLTSPGNPGRYKWLLEAKNNPSGELFTGSDVVNVRK